MLLKYAENIDENGIRVARNPLSASSDRPQFIKSQLTSESQKAKEITMGFSSENQQAYPKGIGC
jgi:hypothetical protein